ncbi:MAG: protoheme IX farnesyltransferase [Chromatiales bacterium]|jgi:heme o synthase|nr:protoheme IX farnesyltransferase [Chromatiales bacterium]
MSSIQPATAVPELPPRQERWRDYLELTKPKVVALIVFTAIVGMCLATPGMVPLPALIFGTIGIGMAAAAGAAYNHIVDSRIDALMARTKNRPLPQGALNMRAAVAFATALCLGSVIILEVFVNTLTAVLTLLSMVGYSVIYTLYLKRATPQNIVIGGAAGAMPPVLGWAAVTGTIDPHALLLFALVFTWTPPHFWALAIHRHADYARAEIPMLPVTHGVPYTRLQVLLYTLLMFVVSLLPFVTRMSGWIYLVGALVLGGVFIREAWRLYVKPEDARQPMRTFSYSIWYLTAMFGFLMADHYIL